MMNFAQEQRVLSFLLGWRHSLVMRGQAHHLKGQKESTDAERMLDLQRPLKKKVER